MDQFATPQATEKYFQWVDLHPQKRRLFDSLAVSALGCGTYLGAADDATDRLYEQCLFKAGSQGINFFDTAINYRCMRSEKNVGKAIRELTLTGIGRDQLVVATKGGYIPCEGNPDAFDDYVRSHYLDTGLIANEEIVAGCHCISPAFLENQIATSLSNLKLECIDLYYLHNPETQLQEVEEEEFYKRLTAAFALFEKKVQEKKIKRYGIATWNGLRLKPNLKGVLQMSRVLAAAKEAGGDSHHFRAIQMPYNLVMLEAIKMKNQGDDKKTICQILQSCRVSLMVSAPLMQHQVAHLPPRVYDKLPREESPMQQALQFVASTPAVCTAFTGMKRSDHLEENLKILHLANWNGADWSKSCQALGV